MIELPEAVTLAKDLHKALCNKEVEAVYSPTYVHKFCWFYGDVQAYDNMLGGHKVTDVTSFGIFVEMTFGNRFLCFNDGVNVTLLAPHDKKPTRYQLLLTFTDGYALVFTVAMYGGIVCHIGEYDNAYYIRNKCSINVLSDTFDEAHFMGLLQSVKPSTSLKAVLATQQGITGLGNGCLQDILLRAGLHAKRKVESLDEDEIRTLFHSVKTTLADMSANGGRDTEKNIYGEYGSYVCLLSKNTYRSGCKLCGHTIVKEAFLGGSIYYCTHCQPMKYIG